MMPRNATKGGFEKFDAQDGAIDKFRKFCTDKNVDYGVLDL